MSEAAMREAANEPVGLSTNEIRERLRQVLPREIFKPQPYRGVIAFAVAAWLVAIDLLQLFDLPWPGRIGIVLVVGALMTTVAFIGHEAVHGAVYRSRFWTNVVAGLGFAPYFLGPEFWRAWHVVHHGHANEANVDPDCLGRLDDAHSDFLKRLHLRVMPGSGGLPPMLYWPISFMGQIAYVLWHEYPRFARSRGRMWVSRAYWFALIAAEVVLGYKLGLKLALLMLLLPQFVANAILSGYFVTNHWIEPITDSNDALANTSSVRTWLLFDWLHGWFSHHQEHHLFPAMNPVFGPLVRREFLKLAPERQNIFPHFRTLLAIYFTPRTYGANDQLTDGRRSFTVDQVKEGIRTRPLVS